MAKYVIRRPFSIHLHKSSKVVQPGGATIQQVNTQSLFSDDKDTPVELTDDEAFAHMHKLEPADGEAKKLFAVYHAKQTDAREARGDGDTRGMEERIASAVVQTLVEAGAIKLAAK